jgi:hypothetical protein
MMNILQALDDPKVFGAHFKRPTWDVWRAFLAALFALPMTPEQLAIYQKYTGRSTPPTTCSLESWLVIGRRGGKSFILATIATYLACFIDWRPFLGPGEHATIMIIAADRKQARTIKRFITGLLHGAPMLKKLIEAETRESITLRNRVSIEIHTASFRTTRGYTIVAALLDEIAFWQSDELSAEPDVEVVNAIRPGMATIPDAMLLCASSPHARKGVLFDAHRKHFAQDNDPVLVWQAATRDMNASVPQSYIDAHLAEDRPRAEAEYMAIFRSDLEAFVLREVVEACISRGIRERAPKPGTSYQGFVDPSGGSADSFTLAIGHLDQSRDVVVIDALRERRPPFSPEQVVGEFADLLKTYKVARISGDRFANIWPVEVFGKVGINYEQNADPKSTIYTNLLPLINSCRVELLDEPRSIAQLCSLERSSVRGGQSKIDHPPNSHDDCINAIAGVAVACINKYGNYDLQYRGFNDDDPSDPDGARAFRVQQLMQHIYRHR